MVRGKCILALSLGLGLWSLVGAQNHALRSDHVVVNSQRHWNNLDFRRRDAGYRCHWGDRSSLRA